MSEQNIGTVVQITDRCLTLNLPLTRFRSC